MTSSLTGKTKQDALPHSYQDRNVFRLFSTRCQVLSCVTTFLIVIGGMWTICLAKSSPSIDSGAFLLSDNIDDEFQLMKQEEMVVTPLGRAQLLSEAPSNTYVLTADDIHQSGLPDLPSLLRRIPGMEVMQMGSAEWNVSARGNNQAPANKLLILIDGRLIYDDIQGLVYWKNLPITLPEIERVEVVKGPVSSVYGFNAFDGVIQIFTKSPQDILGTTFQMSAGEFGTVTAAGIHGGHSGKLGYRLSVGYEQTDQWRDRNALAFQATRANVKTTYSLKKDTSLIFAGGFLNVPRRDGTIAESSRNRSDDLFGYISVSIEHPTEFIRSWWNHNTIDTRQGTHPFLADLLQVTDPQGDPLFHFAFDSFNLDAQKQFQVHSTNRIILGASGRHNRLSSNAIATASQENRFGLYIQDEWQPLSPINVVLGFRVDFHTEINPTYNPRLALTYRIFPQQTLRTSISVAHRSPTLLETHFSAQGLTSLPSPLPSPPPFTLSGNHNLVPEKIITYEVGYQGWFLNHRARLRTDLYWNHLSDLVDASFTPIREFRNAEHADIYGIETSLEFWPAGWLKGFLNLVYQDVKQKFTGSARRTVPEIKFNGGLQGTWANGIRVHTSVSYVSSTDHPLAPNFEAFAALGARVPERKIDSYILWNFRAGYRFLRDQVEVALAMYNILNDRHREHPVGDVIGSRIMGWVTIHIPDHL